MGAPELIKIDTGDVVLGARHWPAGEKRPVLCVHGLSSNARLWDEVASVLAADGHPVLAVDLRGHGSSAGVADIGADPTLTAAADLAAVCRTVGWERPVVAGQSWGGNVVLQLAADQPDLVHGLALVDGGWLHLGDLWSSLGEVWPMLAPPVFDRVYVGQLRARLTNAHPRWPAAGIDATLDNFERLPDGTVRPWLSRDRHKTILGSMLTHRPRELYPRIRCRCKLLAVTSGLGSPHALADEALAALPKHSRLDRYAHGDHDLHAQHPNWVALSIESLA